MKEKFLKDMELRLSVIYGQEETEKIIQEMISALAKYELSEAVTDISVRCEDVNHSLVKKYVACLRLDGKAEGTIKQYVRTINCLAEFVKKPLTECTAYDIRYFLGTIKQRGKKNSHIETQRMYISAFYGWLHVEEIIEKNPCDKVRPIKVESTIRTAFSPVEIDKLRSACKRPMERAVIEIALSSGLRVEELSNLTVFDVDVEKKVIRVRDGKGGKDRVSYMSDVAAEHLKIYLSTRKQNGTPLFISQLTGENMQPCGIRKMVERVGERAGVENVHPHRFRRTFATEMHRRGMDIYSIGKLLGHANIGTTKRYISATDEQLQAEYKRFSA